jgi:putative transcriptional regulator
VLKTGKAKAIRFSTLERLCEVLECEPGDLLAHEKGAAGMESTKADTEILATPE